MASRLRRIILEFLLLALFLFGALILGLGGVIGEFVYELGDMRESDFSRLSARNWATAVGAPSKEFVDHA